MSVKNCEYRTVFLIGVSFFVEIIGYKRKCPDTAQWAIYGKGLCSDNKPSYICLFDENNNRMLEMCEKQPDFQTPGYKFVIRGGFDGEPCDRNRYQPFKFWTNGSSDCLFSKSKCEDEGQLYASYGSTTTDVTCRCDSSKGYAFVHEPLHRGHCRPTIEDCSCYFKPLELPPGVMCNFKKETGFSKTYTRERNGTTERNNATALFILKSRKNGSLTVLLSLILITILIGIAFIVYMVEEAMPKSQRQQHIENEDDNVLLKLDEDWFDIFLPTLMNASIVTVVCLSESDQANVVKHVKSKIQNHGYQVILCNFCPDEIDAYTSKHTKHIILTTITNNDSIDTKIGHWRKLLNCIVEQSNVKLLVTSVLPVFQTQLFQEIDILRDSIFDLKLVYTHKDNQGFGFNPRLFLTDNELNTINGYQCAEDDGVFEVLCKRYAQKIVTGKVEQVELFFKDCVKTVKDDICEDMSNGNKSVFVALLLLVINDNCLAVDMLSSGQLSTQVRNISAMLDVPNKIFDSNLSDSFEFLAKSYIEKTENNYSIANTQIYDICVSYFGKTILPIVLKLPEKDIG